MKAIKRFLSPADAKRDRDSSTKRPSNTPTQRSVSTSSHLGRKARPTSWHTAFSVFSGHSKESSGTSSARTVSISQPISQPSPLASAPVVLPQVPSQTAEPSESSQPSSQASSQPSSVPSSTHTPSIAPSPSPSNRGSLIINTPTGAPTISLTRSASQRVSVLSDCSWGEAAGSHSTISRAPSMPRSVSYSVSLSNSRSASTRTARLSKVVPPRPRRRIDFAGDHPHIITAIFGHTSRSTLIRLRLVSKVFKEHADAQLALHLVLSSPIGSTSLRVLGPDGAQIPGLSPRILYKREDRRRISPVVSSTRVLDFCGPSRARDGEMADITVQCSSVTTVRLRADATGQFPTVCPFPPRATQIVAFTSLAADDVGNSSTPAVDKTARRKSWRSSWHESVPATLSPTVPAHSYIGPVPNRTRRLVVTVSYPKATLVQPPLRQLGTWHHPESLREVVVIFAAQEPLSRARPRSFLSLSSDPSASLAVYDKYHLASELAAQQAGGAARQRRFLSTPPTSGASSPSPSLTIRTTPRSPKSPRARPTSWMGPISSPISPRTNSLPTPTLTVSDADAGTPRTPNFPYPSPMRLGVLYPLIRAMARHLPNNVSYTLVDTARLDPVLLGHAAGTLLSPRQIEREFTTALKQEVWAKRQADGFPLDGSNADAGLLDELKFVSRNEYLTNVGEREWKLETTEYL